MEEELNNVSVSLKTEENEQKTPLHTRLQLAAAALGIICVVLVSVVISLGRHITTVMSEQRRDNISLTVDHLLLWKEKTDFERLTEKLARQRDGLNWTIGVIMEYESFPVHTHCPQKDWRSWHDSRDYCRERKASLVVIESPEEQEFVSNHTKAYNDEKHGYWIGLSNKNEMGTWMWVDGSNVTVMYWMAEPGYRQSCALSLPRADPRANWNKSSCDMQNLWICETRALIKTD
ncbi:C-type lectin domain family 4 member M isoform X2 [Scophthalmus maximus]|uniref:C-type lectin domain family 4 member M isoform X2 n=1 Tax=Scophthalmus maximus TaxID=52904 RepID=UPI001FA8987C|nr:C-type lectin domain family 4 member M isoform X2 [Scophthalmus maximus]